MGSSNHVADRPSEGTATARRAERWIDWTFAGVAVAALMLGVALLTLGWIGDRARAEMRSEKPRPRPQIYAAPQSPQPNEQSRVATIEHVSREGW